MEKQEGKLYTHEGYFKKFMEDLHYKNYASIAKIFAPKRTLISLSLNFQKYPMLFIQGCVILSKRVWKIKTKQWLSFSLAVKLPVNMLCCVSECLPGFLALAPDFSFLLKTSWEAAGIQNDDSSNWAVATSMADVD